MCEALTRKAAKGDVDAARLIFERLLGKVRTAEELENLPPSLIVVNVNRNRERDFALEGIER